MWHCIVESLTGWVMMNYYDNNKYLSACLSVFLSFVCQYAYCKNQLT